jgi:hypothetical protein
MATKTIITPERTTVVEMTAEELAQRETDRTEAEAKATEQAEAKEANDALKASAKAKLIAGEALTEAEANTIVL